MEHTNNSSTSIKNWASDDRPREKMISKGPEALSNSELVAILINNGNKEKSAVELAKEILKLGADNLEELGRISIKDLQKIKGIGEAKAITITAALELGRRRQASAALVKKIVRNSYEIADFLKSTLKDYNYARGLHVEVIHRDEHARILSQPRAHGLPARIAAA